MRDLADRYAFVQPDDRCCLSGGPILAKKFAVFPCMVDQQQCMFYEDELAKEVDNGSVRGELSKNANNVSHADAELASKVDSDFV